jgi:hypothetical protein
MSLEVALPHGGWRPRRHQMKLWAYLQAGGKRAIAVWHRRAGKDEVCLHHAAVSVARRAGNYWHCLPEYQQGRKAIWTAINAHTGRRRIDEAFPAELRTSTNDSEMFIRFINGSTWQVVGADRFDATVGAGVAGVTYSEHALSNPSAWAYHRPMLEENDGWAIFVTTPRGRNHAHEMFKHAASAPGWFAELLTARDTGMLSEAKLDEALAEYRALYGADAGGAQFRQEYLCDWAAAVLGAFYASEMAAVRAEHRVLPVEAMPDRPVDRAWDLGVRDDTAIWFYQVQGPQVVLLDCYSASGVGLEHYLAEIEKREAQYGWRRGTDWVPQDARIKEWTSGRTRVETMQALGLRPMLVHAASIDDGINAARRTLPLCVFHPRCEAGMAALEQHRREWDGDKKAFRASPLHDWTSDKADAFRYLALSWRPAPARVIVRPRQGWVIPPPDEPRRGGMRL